VEFVKFILRITAIFADLKKKSLLVKKTFDFMQHGVYIYSSCF